MKNFYEIKGKYAKENKELFEKLVPTIQAPSTKHGKLLKSINKIMYLLTTGHNWWSDEMFRDITYINDYSKTYNLGFELTSGSFIDGDLTNVVITILDHCIALESDNEPKTIYLKVKVVITDNYYDLDVDEILQDLDYDFKHSDCKLETEIVDNDCT